MKIKKIICLVLILALALPLCACGGGNETYYQLGETVSTDIFEFTLDEADLAIALNSTVNEMFLTPKEYDPGVDNRNPYVASVGHTLVSLEYTVKNINRDSTNFHKGGSGGFIKAIYDGKKYASAYDTFSDEAYYLYEGKSVYDSMSGKTQQYKANIWYRYPSDNLLLGAGSTESRKAVLDIATDVESLNDKFYIVVEVPNSKGKKESFTYYIPERIDEEQTAE